MVQQPKARILTKMQAIARCLPVASAFTTVLVGGLLVSLSKPAPAQGPAEEHRWPAADWSDPAFHNANLIAQREGYRQARQAIDHGKPIDTHLQQLQHYPLTPYLHYYQLSKQLSSLPYRAVDQFLDQHANTYLADRLRRQWLDLLAKRKRWHEYQSYYNPARADTAQHCTWLYARLETGEEAALAEVATLWNVGHSQPKACDKLFKRWQTSPHYTDQLAWERATKALAKRNRTLVRYIGKYAPQPAKDDIKRLLWIDRHPTQLSRLSQYSGKDEREQFIVMHGIERLARKQAKNALQLWEKYDASGLYPTEARRQLQETLIRQLSRQGYQPEADALVATMTDTSSERLQLSLLRQALEHQQWQRVQRLIKQLPEPLAQSDRWQYWALRAAESLGQTQPPYPSPEQGWQTLAKQRSFYGFMAADRLGQPYAMQDEPSIITQADQMRVAGDPGLARARELFALNQIAEARQEWLYASRNLTASQLQAAGNLASHWGWHRSGIQAMIAARAWDDLQVRFPLAFEDLVHQQARNLGIDPNLVFAIARQESAFAPDARSPVGALGLMQLMPATAKHTARKAGLRYSKRALLKPETNIALGSRYLNEMLTRFEHNPAYAAAAYNAGPHRVEQWLADNRDQLPLDIWIETIPYKETRGYVQNVMVFSVIYAYRSGTPPEALKGKLPVTTPPAKSAGIRSYQGLQQANAQASP